MQWLHPTYLWALLALPLAAGLYYWAARKRREAAEQFGDPGLLAGLMPEVHAGWRRTKTIAVCLAVALLALALAGPRIGTQLREVEQRGIDLVVALDVSQSMKAQDVSPDRLEKAKLEIQRITEALPGDRVGLVLFAGEAFLQCPLTVDRSAFGMFLDVAEPTSIPTPGTNFEAAIRTALDAFDRSESEGDETPSEERTRALLLISDGEQHREVPTELRDRLQREQVVTLSLGVGRQEGAPIPVLEEGRRIGYKRNEQGQVIQTRLQTASLEQLAGEGRYFELSGPGSVEDAVVETLEDLQRTSLGTRQFETYKERYGWPLALALLLLAIEPMVREYRRRERTPTTA